MSEDPLTTEPPKPPPAEAGPLATSARGRWAAVFLAALLCLAGMVSLEMLHRAEITDLLGHPVRDWCNPELRALSTGYSCAMLSLGARAIVALRPLLSARPPDEVAAAAAHQLGSYDLPATPTQRLEYARQAVLLVPDRSPKLVRYYFIYEIENFDRSDELPALLQQALERDLTDKQRGRLLADGLVSEEEWVGESAALASLQSALQRWPGLRAQPEMGSRLTRLQAIAQASAARPAPEVKAPGH